MTKKSSWYSAHFLNAIQPNLKGDLKIKRHDQVFVTVLVWYVTKERPMQREPTGEKQKETKQNTPHTPQNKLTQSKPQTRKHHNKLKPAHTHKAKPTPEKENKTKSN